jgi:hypothetical protein
VDESALDTLATIMYRALTGLDATDPANPASD